jgi:hypothetical protein
MGGTSFMPPRVDAGCVLLRPDGKPLPCDCPELKLNPPIPEDIPPIPPEIPPELLIPKYCSRTFFKVF